MCIQLIVKLKLSLAWLNKRVFRIAAVADLWSVYSRFDGRREVNVVKAAKKYRGIKSIRHS